MDSVDILIHEGFTAQRRWWIDGLQDDTDLDCRPPASASTQRALSKKR